MKVNTLRDAWRCFHCDAIFTNRKHAAEHFGTDESATPACRLTGSEGHLVTYIRKLEAENAVYRAEDSYILRAWHAKEFEHAEAVRRAEELGYSRGIRDMNIELETQKRLNLTLADRCAKQGDLLSKRAERIPPIDEPPFG